MHKKLKTSPSIVLPLLALSILLLLVSVSTAIGFAFGLRHSGSQATPNLPLMLNADTATKGRTMSMATGPVTSDVEGLFVLDHESGDLQCWILNPRTGAVGGIYKTNVLIDLPRQADKTGAGDYLMVTGGFLLRTPVANNMAPSACICYVADEDTGNVVGYSFNLNPQAVNRGIPQSGALVAVCGGPTRMGNMVRDQ